ncbi:MAG: aspartate kinase [Actinobacteria bacterium]|nr:aspartate kinase [Actinomycetota bacterium]
MKRPLVIKFGGTSVGGSAEMVRAANVVAETAQNGPVAVVVSAMAGTTDALLGYADATAGSRTTVGETREETVAELHRTLAERHLRAAREAVSEEHFPEVEERIFSLLERLVEVVEEPSADPSARRDGIAVYGERLSAAILAGAIRSLDIPAAVVSGDPIATNGDFGEAEVLGEETRRRAGEYAWPLLEADSVAVVPGYVGRAPDGSVTTLGRGGSDFSATVLGRALGSSEVWIMSDVEGVLDADPRVVPGATLMPQLSYREATLFATLGAKILHPKTMEPASEAGIEVFVRNSFDPASPGTRISDRGYGEGLRCVALRRDLAIEIPCTQGREQRVASVVCIGMPEDGDLARGTRCLKEAGILPLHAGVSSAGLVFFASNEAGEEALRTLHAALIPAVGTAAEEVA